MITWLGQPVKAPDFTITLAPSPYEPVTRLVPTASTALPSTKEESKLVPALIVSGLIVGAVLLIGAAT
jgi:hypothetical protein